MKVNFGQLGTWIGDIGNILKAVQDVIGIKNGAAKGFTTDFGS